MGQLLEFILQFLTQFAGGPGAPENNLVRFALPALFWLVLLVVAWTRQRQEYRAREKLLVWGFLLAFLREGVMLFHWTAKIISGQVEAPFSHLVEPVEHTLTLVAIIVIATAFLRFVLDDDRLALGYMLGGLVLVAASYLVSYLWFSRQLTFQDGGNFHETIPATILHALSSLLIVVAMVILIRQKGWLSNVVIIALSFLFMGEFLILINQLNNRVYDWVLCPIANSFHIWAVPLFGFVYFREQTLEKKRAEQKLNAYQGHLEDLVAVRTAELTEANKQLERAAVLEERQRIAAEMHDGLAQTLSTLGLKADCAADMLQEGQVDQVLADFDQMQEILGQAVLDVRRSIASLQENPQPIQSLQELINQSAGENSQATFDVRDDLLSPLFLPKTEQEQVMCVIKEALLNINRHAHAQNVMIEIAKDGGNYVVEIDDDGIGFSPRSTVVNGDHHFGLSIMAARAARINGQFRVQSSPGNGCRIIMTWPISELKTVD